MKKLLILSLLIISGFTSLAQSYGNFRQLRFFVITSASDTAETVANSGRVWYDFNTDTFRCNIDGVNTTLGGGNVPSGLSPLGTALQQLRVNAGETALEYFTPLFNPATTDGDLIYFNGTTYDRLAIGANGTGLISDGTNPTWGTLLTLPATGTGLLSTDGVSLTIPSGATTFGNENIPNAAMVLTAASSVANTSFSINSKGNASVFLGNTGLNAFGVNATTELNAFSLSDVPFTISAFNGNSSDLIGNNLILKGGNGHTVGNNNGGDIILQSGVANGSGIDGDVIIDTRDINGTFKINSGANEQAGIATLVGGTVTVNNTKVTANSMIFHSHRTAGGTIGVITYTIVAGTSFTLTSTSGTDTSTVNWWIVEPN